MRIFIAGASGVIGIRLCRLLAAAGHEVAGMTRSPDKAARLREAGAEPVVCDVFDAPALSAAVTGFGPDVIFHQLTDLPDDAAQIAEFSERNNRIRTEGTANLIAAAKASTAGGSGGSSPRATARVIAQSISWEIPGTSAATAAHERAVLSAGGVVIRYGQLWGPGTYYESGPPDPPRIHVDDAARLTVPSLDVPAGVTIVADDRALAT